MIGSFGKGVDSRLHRWLNSEFRHSPGRFGVEAAAQRVQQTVQGCVYGRVSHIDQVTIGDVGGLEQRCLQGSILDQSPEFLPARAWPGTEEINPDGAIGIAA